ncbi:hypothetical protein [Kribbella italica]|uniref:Uncharacterized protein n=1 Tax=Kribbella italica TaxID=1540520 RepID=A0A7W9MXS6_9ACTN|nr:hypothetical protein [Kribbella italica]MBB5840436.1 hypothetical protein [Kribbella italica]
MNDPAETLVTESLEAHAASAPSDAALLGTVHRRLRRRRRARSTGAVVLVCAAVAVAGVGLRTLVHPADPGPGPTASIAQPPPGWHWESYADVEVQVPDTWAEIGAGPLSTCPDQKPPVQGWVGRPTMLTTFLSACGNLPPASERVPYLLFDFNATAGVTQYDAGWTKEVRRVGVMGLTAFGADDAVRARVLDSARKIDGADSNGCAPTHRAATDAVVRPAGPGLTAIGAVESIRICAYRTQQLASVPPLLASAGLTGDQARTVGAALRDAPMLPNVMTSSKDQAAKRPLSSTHSSKCLTTSDNEILVVQLHGDRGDQEVVVRLASCGPLDTDDGRRVRSLTKASVGPLLDAVGRPEDRSPLLERLLK